MYKNVTAYNWFEHLGASNVLFDKRTLTFMTFNTVWNVQQFYYITRFKLVHGKLSRSFRTTAWASASVIEEAEIEFVSPGIEVAPESSAKFKKKTKLYMSTSEKHTDHCSERVVGWFDSGSAKFSYRSGIIKAQMLLKSSIILSLFQFLGNHNAMTRYLVRHCQL